VTRGARLGFDERRDQRLLAWAIAVVFVLGLLSFIAKGADEPADPFLKPQAATGLTVPARSAVAGYGEVAFRVVNGPKLCALLAQTAAQQARGLMKRTDLAGHAGMLFVFASDTTETFYMRNTPIPLSIAWFDAAGRWISQTDMTPCADKPNCPTYAAARAYRYALEVPQGGLSGLGVGPGSSISVGGGC
jgi:uncharacterized membrane protein (UPF0127 family)